MTFVKPELNINFHGRQFSGSTVGIVGMGRIGMAVAKRAAAFDCKILYHNRSQRSDEATVGATYYKGIDLIFPAIYFKPIQDEANFKIKNRL